MKDRIKTIILIVLIFVIGFFGGKFYTIQNAYVLEHGNDYIAISYGDTDIYYSIDF